METLVKETTTLHRVLSRYLQGPTVELVMGQVFSSINARLAEEFENAELKSQKGRERMLADAKYLTSRLGDLKGTESPAPGSVSFGAVFSGLYIVLTRFLNLQGTGEPN
jgi:vacuolar protein sorting-associated protein 54